MIEPISPKVLPSLVGKDILFIEGSSQRSITVDMIEESGLFDIFNIGKTSRASSLPIYVLTDDRKLYRGSLQKSKHGYFIHSPEVTQLGHVCEREYRFKHKGLDHTRLSLLIERLKTFGWTE